MFCGALGDGFYGREAVAVDEVYFIPLLVLAYRRGIGMVIL